MTVKHSRRIECERCTREHVEEVINPRADWKMPEGWTNNLMSETDLCATCSRLLRHWMAHPGDYGKP